jgi:hypothetical protein
MMAAKKSKIVHDDIDRMPYDANKTDRYVLIRDGEEIFRGTHADCYATLLKRQHRSSAYALRFGGWECKHVSVLSLDDAQHASTTDPVSSRLPVDAGNPVGPAVEGTKSSEQD